MSTRNPRLAAARRHGERALSELRHLSADAALYWVLSHRTRVAQLRKAVKGTRAAPAFDALLAAIREESSAVKPARAKRAAPVRHRAAARRRTARTRQRKAPSWLRDLPALKLPLF